MSSKQLGDELKTGLAAARRADDAGVEIAGVGRIFGPSVDGEQFRSGENDIVFKLGIDKRLDVFGTAPSCRPILFISPEFLCVLAFEVDQQTEGHRTHDANQQSKGLSPGAKSAKAGPILRPSPSSFSPNPAPVARR